MLFSVLIDILIQCPMTKKYLDEIKTVSIRDLEVFELFLKKGNLKSISSKLDIEPKEASLILLRIIKKFKVAFAKIPINGKEKILTISDSDISSFKDSRLILYRLKIIRKLYNFTMQDIGKKIGIERQTYSKIENGEIDLNDKYIGKIRNFFISIFIDKLVEFTADYNDDISQYELDGSNQVNINKMIWYHNFLQPLSDYEKKVLSKVGKEDNEDILAQLLLYTYVVNHIYYLVRLKADLNKKIKEKALPFKQKLSPSKSHQKKFRLINNEILYANGLREYIFSNLKKKDFILDKEYYSQLLFLPRVTLNNTILNKITNLIKEFKK